MALTNFSQLTSEQKTVWSKDLWKNARNQSFIGKFLGDGPTALVQHITELKKSEKGARAVITLLADLTGDGVAGDRQLEGNEEAMQTFDQVIRIDQLRHANRLEGRMADQKSVVEFRNNSKNVLSYWLADRIDQMAFLTMAGISYSKRNNGAPRAGSDLPFLEFAGDVTAPTSGRRFWWNGTSKTLVAGGVSSQVTANDTCNWEMFVLLKAAAKNAYMRGVMVDGEETFHAFLTPSAFANLKLDPTYLQNLRHAQAKGKNEALFTGSSVLIDGIHLHEFRHVPNTSGAIGGNKFGALGTVDGCQVLFCGAQALGFADIGAPEWVEKSFDFDNQQAISTGKIIGMLKPQFGTIYENGVVEDFGVMSCYIATQ